MKTPPTQRPSRTARIIILSFSPLCKRNSSSFRTAAIPAQGRAWSGRDTEHTARLLRTNNLARDMRKGRKDLPNPDGLLSIMGAAAAGSRRGTSRRKTSGLFFCVPPAFFACVSHAEKPQSNLLSCSGVGPCPAVLFCTAGGDVRSPPAVFFLLHVGYVKALSHGAHENSHACDGFVDKFARVQPVSAIEKSHSA